MNRPLTDLLAAVATSTAGLAGIPAVLAHALGGRK